MRGLGNAAIRSHPQAFLFQSGQALPEGVLAAAVEQFGKSLFGKGIQGLAVSGGRCVDNPGQLVCRRRNKYATLLNTI